MDSIIDGKACDFEDYPYTCAECYGTFSQEEWDNRHSNSDGDDVHSYCCTICSQHRVVLNSGGIDWKLLSSQARILGAFQERHYSALHNPEIQCDELIEIDMLPSEDDAVEGVLNLIESMLDHYKGESYAEI